jgi:hypothetical protein
LRAATISAATSSGSNTFAARVFAADAAGRSGDEDDVPGQRTGLPGHRA